MRLAKHPTAAHLYYCQTTIDHGSELGQTLAHRLAPIFNEAMFVQVFRKTLYDHTRIDVWFVMLRDPPDLGICFEHVTWKEPCPN